MMFSLRVLRKMLLVVIIGLGVVSITTSLLLNLAQMAAPSSLITAEDRSLVRNGVRFEVRGMNYYPKDFAWDRFWENYTDPVVSAQINQELDKARLLGVNTVRLFIPYHLFSGTVQSAPYPNYLRDFINRLQARNMVAIVTLFDFYANDSAAPYSSTDYLASKQHISLVVNTLGITNPTILAYDLKNELDREYAIFGKAPVKAWAMEMVSHIRQLDPNHLLTIGFYGVVTGTLCYNSAITTQVYSPAIVAEFIPSVDFASMHYFLSERCFENVVQALQTKVGNKPIILEEFGLHTLSNPALANSPHTEIEQAAYYNTLLSISKAYGLAGYLFWTLNDFSYLFPGLLEPERCLGILRNSKVNICQVTNPGDYDEKLAAEAVRRHYEHRVTYLDLFDAWVDSNTDKPPAGWSDNLDQGGALLRGYNLSQSLWSHNRGKVVFTKIVLPGTPVKGVAISPVLKNINVSGYAFLTGQVFNYKVRDPTNGSNGRLYIGVKEGGQITRLLTITSGTSLPYAFKLDLRQPPTHWTGVHTFQIVLELAPETPNNGYSAAYELDWIGMEGFVTYLPLILK